MSKLGLYTGQERDAETNLDFFQARYMSSGLARFMSPDPYNAGADLTNPQSWNGYGYVGGQPLVYTDPTGEDFGGFLNWLGGLLGCSVDFCTTTGGEGPG
jgi:RHS repeat-associated protein